VKISALQRPQASLQTSGIFSCLTDKIFSIFTATLLLFLTGCPQDNSGRQGNSGLQEQEEQKENTQLKKQVTKLESIIHSLQEGNKIMQQQINLLNQEARETAERYEKQLRDAEAIHQEQLRDAQTKMTELVNGPKKDVARIKTLEQENRKLEGETKWLRSQREQMRKALTLQQIGGQTQELPFSFSSVSTII